MKFMSDRPQVHRDRYTSTVDILILVILIGPFIIISGFNNPLGDDFWITSMVRKDGFIQAQKILYDTVSARYTLLTLASLSPLSFGNFWLYKLIPIIFVVLFFFVFAFLLKACFGQQSSPQASGQKTSSREETDSTDVYNKNNSYHAHNPITDSNHNLRDFYFLSGAFTALYINVMLGLGEGIYWFSSLMSYQEGILTFILWLAGVCSFYNNTVKGGTAIVCLVLFLALLGFNEPLALIASILNGLILSFRIRKKSKFFVPLICLALSTPIWYYLLSAPSFTLRYVSTVKPGGGQLIKSAWFSIQLAIYHIGKCLINPFCWLCIIIAFRPMASLSRKVTHATGLGMPKPRFVILYCLASMFIIGFVSSYYSPSHVVSLRLTNMSIFIFLSGSLYVALCYLSSIQQWQWVKIRTCL
jgi:hypothetical protein